jgi:hypothetical protein
VAEVHEQQWRFRVECGWAQTSKRVRTTEDYCEQPFGMSEKLLPSRIKPDLVLGVTQVWARGRQGEVQRDLNERYGKRAKQ